MLSHPKHQTICHARKQGMTQYSDRNHSNPKRPPKRTSLRLCPQILQLNLPPPFFPALRSPHALPATPILTPSPLHTICTRNLHNRARTSHPLPNTPCPNSGLPRRTLTQRRPPPRCPVSSILPIPVVLIELPIQMKCRTRRARAGLRIFLPQQPSHLPCHQLVVAHGPCAAGRTRVGANGRVVGRRGLMARLRLLARARPRCRVHVCDEVGVVARFHPEACG